jgi:signal transduction histidine kinase
VRLTYIADRIATLIDSERRRNLQITLVERKRLERDLHDSVSQKLYGLITLTEAAYAAIESHVDPMDIITKISENARQAVKEMRLFLFQVQPLDVEREGLISVIHHRLAAVEGRADIKVTFYAGEKVTLDDSVSKEKEVAMYFIAQEALNNALRHSSAKTVTITLKEGPRNVILQIQDDGCGFDSKKIGRGGHGLRNMKERAALIDASLAVSSEPNKGTRVVITVPKDYVQ